MTTWSVVYDPTPTTLWLIGYVKIFNFMLEEKLDQYFVVKFNKESEFGSFGAEKSSRDPLSNPL